MGTTYTRFLRALALASSGAMTVYAGPALAQAALEEIIVTADRKNSFGAQYVQAGSFRGARQIDTPLSVSVLPRDILEAQQATQLYDALRNTAGVTYGQIGGAIYSNMAIRGIVVENRGNYRLNGGLPIVNLIDMPLEDKERVEVLKGVSALYYGFTSPSGIVNLTMKRPVDEVNDFTVFGNNHGSIGGHADIGRKFFDGKLGVRLNFVEADLDVGIDRTKGDRSLQSAAVDFDPVDTIKIRLDAERITKKISEPNFYLVPAAVNGVVTLPPIPNPKKNLGDVWMYNDAYEVNLLAHIEWKFLPNWQVMAEAGTSHTNRTRFSPQFQNYNLATGAGQLNLTLTNGNLNRNINYRSEIAGAFDTGPISHEISFGFTRNVREAFVTSNPTVNLAQNLYNPTPLTPVPLPDRVVPNPTKIDDRGYYLFDRLKYQEWLQLLIGVRRTIYSNTSRTTRYSTTANSPALGVVVKPAGSWLSLYGTYIEGLEEGGIAPATARNPGVVLPPGTTKQWEVGVKAEPLEKLLLTLGYFDIDRPSSFVDPVTNFFVQDGRSSYKGVEASATGEINEQWSIYATTMYLETKQEKAANATLIGKRTENAPRLTVSVFGEYRTPWVPGLSLSAGLYHVASRAVNQTNTAFVGGFTTFDAGARYNVDLRGVPTTFRLSVENVFDKHYWASTGSSLLAANLPMTAKFSMTARF